MTKTEFDLAIAGSGIMGLACALQAAKSGKKVMVFDPSEESAKASWAAAGILVTRDAHHFLSPFREFYVRSIQQYPTWLQEIQNHSGMKIPLYREGDYQIYDLSHPKGEEQGEAKRKQLEREKSQNYTVTSQLPAFLNKEVSLKKVAVYHFPQEAYIQNRDLLGGLKKACDNLGVTFITKLPIGPWDFSGGKTHLNFDAKGHSQYIATQVLIAAGAWSQSLLDSLGYVGNLIPVKGQMMRIPKFYSENCMVHFEESLYLVPRSDSLIIGATTEAGIWKEGFDEIGEEYLGKKLAEFLPSIAKNKMESWAGFRPRTRDRLPWMGWLNAEKGWALCTGHYKCGISMAPLAAECMNQLLRDEKTKVDLDPFNPWRKQGLSKKL